LILDALESTNRGNLIGAIAYLEDQMLRHEGDTTYALSALSYLEGLYQSYVYIGEAALGAQKRREERERAKAWAIQARGRKLFDPTANDSFKLLQYRMTPPEEKPVLDIIAELFVKGFLKTGELFEKATKPFYRKQTESLVSLSDPTNKNLLSPPPPIQPDLAWRWEEKTRPRLVGTRTRRSRAISEAAKRATTYVELIRHLEEQAAETRAVDHESYGPDDAAHAISYLQGQAAYFDLLLDAYR
jgi:hypothetical protein